PPELEKQAKAAKATLGPSGRNFILDKKFGSPTITKDGGRVAKEIELEDPYENMGAQLVAKSHPKLRTSRATARQRRPFSRNPFTAKVSATSPPAPTRRHCNAAS